MPKYKVIEATIQAVLMQWAMNKKHHLCILPNSNQFFDWECDLISITRSQLIHEFEIKLNRSDYNRDAVKRKHYWIGDKQRAPAYFWYVTFSFDIEPPEKAGWIYIWLDEANSKWHIDVKKEAPRLNNWKADSRKQARIAKLLSYRITNYYINEFMFLRNNVDSEHKEK
jgi:hypothetical protein